jgi:hypothetical protein
MKKKLKMTARLFAVLCWFTGTASAQDIDSLVKNAVDGLVARYNTPITVSIKTPTIGSTDSVSAFSGYLSRIIERNAVNNSLYRVTAPARGAPPIRTGDGQRGQITGSYDLAGDQVEVALTLIAEPGGNRLAATAFKVSRAELEKLNLDVLPENRKTEAEVQTQAALFEDIPLSPPPAPVISPVPALPPSGPMPPVFEPADADSPPGADVSAQSELTAQTWPNKENRTYFDGDAMTISLYASRDCWFKVYHIDVNNQMQLIYPSQTDRNNTLRANTVRVIPDNTVFKLGAPYGEETILAVFSGIPFENLEKDMLYPVPATRDSINRAAGRRGLTVQQAANIPDAPPEKTMAVRFSYTILPANFIEATFSFRRPSDMAGAVQLLRNEISLRNGTFSGNEREGTYNLDDIRGSYRINNGEVILVISRPSYQSAVTHISPARGAGGGFNFSFAKPTDLSNAVTSVKTAIEKKGGVFIGDTSTGNFKASGIAGNYRVQDRVFVTIQEKPFIIPNQLIEKEVKNYFGAR